MRQILLCLLILPFMATAQNAEKNIQHNIFDGKGTISLPAGYSLGSRVVVVGDDRPLGSSFTNKATHQGVYCLMKKERQTTEQFRQSYDDLKSSLNFEYLEVLRDEYVSKDGKLYFQLECRLKPAFYKDGEPNLKMADGTVYPNYFIYHYIQKNGITASTAIDYGGDEAGLQAVREQSNQIVTSFRIL